ncbi:uncharacterized protein LOC111715871 [Eurytemora carolleeae]|uniref:uncharacterized protein LOC111715871 n=1 Tax=Eurytemora carolleeae TaxID=1294199 RepID=UPI000C7682CE|nr:uncharacterized protein LOC111715871 [Eurytemora carolleeae]|eukprot:XP_023347037.1 uncharacterized protein LOC111715871 [Eurytemora affinis]
MKVKDKKDNQTDESLLHSAVELLKNGGCQLKALHLNLTSYCPGIRRKHVYKIISSNPEIFIFNSVIEGSGATLVKKDTIITLNPDYSTNQVQNKDPTADLSEDLFTIATIICVLRQEMPCSLKILHLNLSEYNLEINKKKLLSILNGSHQIFTILYDVSSTSRSNPVVSLNQETYILLSKQPNKDTSKGKF